MVVVADPVNFGIDPERGFLPTFQEMIQLDIDRDIKLAMISEFAALIPKLLAGRRMSLVVNSLPEMSDVFLRDMHISTLNRLMRELSFIAHAYVHEDPQNRRDSIPANLALSWYRVAKLLGRPPVLSYKSYALDNWIGIEDGPVNLSNVALINNFYGGLDEEWFVLVHVEIENKAAPIIRIIPEAQQAVLDNDLKKLQQCLEVIALAQAEIIATLRRMPENCDPSYIYFNRVRPFIHGWDRRPLVYEGIAEYAGQPQKFRGETGAQSSIVPTLDALLDVYHAPNEMTQYLDDMLNYMPPNHRNFIAAVGDGPSVKAFVVKYKNDRPRLREAYNENVSLLHQFRSLHLKYAWDYVFSHLPKTQNNPSNRGTGGTPPEYLKKHCDETLASVI